MFVGLQDPSFAVTGIGFSMYFFETGKDLICTEIWTVFILVLVKMCADYV